MAFNQSYLFRKVRAVSALAAILAQPNVNLQQNTLNVEIPFYQTEHPNPRGPKFPIALRTHISPPLLFPPTEAAGATVVRPPTTVRPRRLEYPLAVYGQQNRMPPAAAEAPEDFTTFSWHQSPSEPIFQKLRINPAVAGETRVIRRVTLPPAGWNIQTNEPVRRPHVTLPSGETRTIRRVTLPPTGWLATIPDRTLPHAPTYLWSQRFAPLETPAEAAQEPFKQKSIWPNPLRPPLNLYTLGWPSVLPPIPEEVVEPQAGTIFRAPITYRWPRLTARPDFVRGIRPPDIGGEEVEEATFRAPITYRRPGLGPRPFFVRGMNPPPPLALEDSPFRQSNWPNPYWPRLNLYSLGQHTELPPEEDGPVSFVHQVLSTPPGYLRNHGLYEFRRFDPSHPVGTPEFDTSWRATYPDFARGRPPTYTLGSTLEWDPTTPVVAPARPHRRLFTVAKVGF